MTDDYGLFMTYFSNMHTRTLRGQSCPRDSCMINTLCRAATTNFDDFFYCVEENTMEEPEPTEPTVQPTPPYDGSGVSTKGSVLALGLVMLVIGLL